MPNIRIVNWNLRNLSRAKLEISGVARAIARTIVALNPDIVILLETRWRFSAVTMQWLAGELNIASGNAGLYGTWQLSHLTGSECYGYFVRDTRVVRPMTYGAHPEAPAPANLGERSNPIANLEHVRWQTYSAGAAWGAAVPAGQVPGAAPLVTCFSEPAHARAAKRPQLFRGQALENNGYALGRGSRLPCLSIFHVNTAAADYYLPIVSCHYGAVRGGRNPLAQGQIKQLHELHIAQLFAPTSGCLYINGAPVGVRELIFTGDFNVDFKQNLALGSNLAMTNRQALAKLTPTEQMGGSATPVAAEPGPPGPPQPFAPHWSPEPEQGTIPAQALRAAVTWQGTIFRRYPAGPKPPFPVPLPPLPTPAPPHGEETRTAAFDNFFYGGTQAKHVAAAVHPPAWLAPAPQPDSGQVDEMNARIVPPPPLAGGQIAVSGAAKFYGPTHGASWAPNLQVFGAALTDVDRWIGALLVSDHVPVVLEIPCP